jgi:hypothetical protein
MIGVGREKQATAYLVLSTNYVIRRELRHSETDDPSAVAASEGKTR